MSFSWYFFAFRETVSESNKTAGSFLEVGLEWHDRRDVNARRLLVNSSVRILLFRRSTVAIVMVEASAADSVNAAY